MNIKHGKIAKNILLILAVAGLLTIASTSPYFLYNLAREIIRYSNKQAKKYKYSEIKKIARSLSGLNKNKIIILKEANGKFIVKLSEKGKKAVREIQFENMKIEKPKTWDKKWRIIIFDIPEAGYRVARDVLRSKLQKLGFYLIQKSVWVYPYPCEKEIQLMCEIYEINPYVNIVTAEKIYNDDAMKKYFRITN